MRAFTPAAERSVAANLARTCGQMLAFWAVFIVALPWVIVRTEAALVVPAFAFAGQRLVALVFGVTAAALNLWSGVALAVTGRGTPFPTQTARELVVSGPYRWLRNPMAVGGLGVGFAVGLYLGSWTTLAYAVVGGVTWHLVARPMEEDDLARRFGDSYTDYRGRVRCWVPRRTPYRRASDGRTRTLALVALLASACSGGNSAKSSASVSTSTTSESSHGGSTTGSAGTTTAATDTSGSATDDTSGTTVECVDVPVTPGGPAACGGTEFDLWGPCEQLAGYEECPSGDIHRHSVVPCYPSEPLKACTQKGGFICESDRDCPDFPTGRCVGSSPCFCWYACTEDDACGPDGACICGMSYPRIPEHPWWGNDACVASNCRTDADCPGSTCSLSIGPCYQVEGLFCHTPDDECDGPADCPRGFLDRCYFSPEESRWVCGEFNACE